MRSECFAKCAHFISVGLTLQPQVSVRMASTGKVVTSELALGPPSLKRSPNIFNKHNVAIFPQVAEGGDVEGQAAAACPQDNSATPAKVITNLKHNVAIFPHQVAEGGDVEGQAAAAHPQDNSDPVVQVIFLAVHNSSIGLLVPLSV